MPGGDGASLDDELGREVWRMLRDPEILNALTDDELKGVVDILKQAWQRKQGR